MPRALRVPPEVSTAFRYLQLTNQIARITSAIVYKAIDLLVDLMLCYSEIRRWSAAQMIILMHILK